MMVKQFRDRTDAGQRLAQQLMTYANQEDVVILAIPRGGVPVAYEIAKALNAPLNLCLIRKLGLPHRPETAMGAVSLDGLRVLNRTFLQQESISQQVLEQVTNRELNRLEKREHLYHSLMTFESDEQAAVVPFSDRVVILVDDGIATGATMQTALLELHRRQPRWVIVAVPVAPISVEQGMDYVDDFICGLRPDPLHAVGHWYQDFSQISDQTVCQLLAAANAHSTSQET